MHPLAERVWRTIRRHDLIPHGGRVIAALSGGSDSVALVHLLRELEPAHPFSMVAVAHLNHCLRGEASDGDARFSRGIAANLAIPFETASVDVSGRAGRERISIEDAARRARYEFLGDVAARYAADRIAVGHTRDDQAETFLLRLLRGSGSRGLAGIHPRVGTVIRPLLDVARAGLRGYLGERALPFREDESNLDVRIPRNRIRHELLPLIRARFSPGIDAALAREAELVRFDDDLLERVASAASGETVATLPGGFRIDVATLLAQPRAISRRVVQGALQRASGRRFVGLEHVERFLEMAGDQAVHRREFPGAHAERDGRNVVLMAGGSRRAAPARPFSPFRYPLSVPGEVWVPEAGCCVQAERLSVPAASVLAPALSARGISVAIEARELLGSLAVRNRRPGDVLRPLGLGGRKKLQDFFVDRKIRRSERDRAPLVVDERDRIIWVAGHTVSDEFRVTDRTEAVVILRLKDLGGKA